MCSVIGWLTEDRRLLDQGAVSSMQAINMTGTAWLDHDGTFVMVRMQQSCVYGLEVNSGMDACAFVLCVSRPGGRRDWRRKWVSSIIPKVS